jgi:hypothetical protein
MRKFIKTSMLAACCLALVAGSAQAQYNNNDLILGFENATFNGTTFTGPNDYIIDLGQPSVVGVGGAPGVPLTLSGFNLSTFTGLYTSLSGGVNMGVVGGNGVGTTTRNVFLTQLRAALGDPTMAGSMAPTPINSTSDAGAIGSVANMVNALPLSPGGSTTITPGSGNSWSQRVSPNQVLAPLPSFLSATGRDPMAGVSTGTLIFEDLWRGGTGTGSNPFTYLGFFTLDTGVGSLTFTPAVPEPSTYGAFAGAGLLLLALRRQFSGTRA